MSWALASYLENCGEASVKGFPGRELSLDPGRSRFERLYANLLGAPANGLRIRLRRVLPATDGSYPAILDAGCGSGVFSYELAKRHPEAKVIGVELEPDLVARANEIAKRAHLSNCSFQQGDVTKLDFEDAVRPGRERRQLRARRGRHRGDARRCCTRCAPAGGWSPTSPATSGGGSCFGRRVNFDVPGHVRPGYRAEELVGKLQRGRVRGHAATSTPTGCSRRSPTTSPT